MIVQVGETLTETVQMTPDDVRAFARAAHDFNPLHHDDAVAAASRYKKLIASGTQTAARLMALPATHFSKRCDVVGLDFSLRFHRAVFADEAITLEWTVTSVTPSPSMNGDLVEMKGRVLNEAGDMAVSATARILVSEKL